MVFSAPSGTIAETTSLANPVSYYKSQTGYYPSNAQTWWSMKRPPEVGSNASPKQYLEVFDPALRHQVSFGNSLAPRGHYILDPYRQDRSAASGVYGLTGKTAQGIRPNSVVFYAGRVFYGGVNVPGYNTKIFFSQVLERPEQVSACYQEQDPTSEDLNALLPTDGGVIEIPEISQIQYMLAYGYDLFVFADNGVWSISGSEGIGFRANDYSVRKLSGTPAISASSFVTVEGVPIWWNFASINTLAPSQGGFQVTSLTDDSIKQLYEAIPQENKLYAKGAYDPLTRTVQFVYRQAEIEATQDRWSYDSILVLDIRTGAWYPWSTPDTERMTVKGIINLEGSSTQEFEDPVLVDSDPVLVDTDQVTIPDETRQALPNKFLYTVDILDDPGDSYNGITFAEAFDTDLVDCTNLLGTGINYDSYFDAGYSVYGEADKDFQSNYVTVNYENVDGHEAYIQGKWDYAQTNATGRWSQRQTIRAVADAYKHGSQKFKIRGRGKALQISIKSKDNSPFHINGWTVFVTKNGTV
jgi:hypothetical protein